MDKKINYVRDLIKGKITETIFEEMFRESGEFTILPMGYEHTLPELAQYQHHIEVKQVLENIRHTPDFVLISQDKARVFLVEVKYRKSINTEEMLKIAEDTLKLWNPSYLFIATQDGFYFSPCNWIINNSKIEALSSKWIDKRAQEKYLNVHLEFTPRI